jgi:SAM-dependent methyltransferase
MSGCRPTRGDEAERVAVEQFTAHADSFASSPIINDAAALDALADLAQVSGTDRVLDVACGPGIVSCDLAARGATVVGMDITPAMLDLAARRAARLGVSDRTTFVPGSMDRLPFADGEFSVVVSRYALHHAVTPERALAEMTRVLGPNGRMVIVDFVASDDPETAQAYDEAEKLRDPSHVRNLSAAEQRELFESLGLRVDATASYGLRADLDAVLAGSHGHDHEGARHAFEASVDTHGLGVGAHRVGDRIAFTYPIIGFRLARGA